ncbi:MAG TPA: GntR family transcriptional regulator, partial [Cellvibrionaceae bacterium]|nr:GntR family transcriptional regulator [Cellvibrionaceae bacterium]
MEPKPNAQEIYERLRSMIMSLQLMPGSRITENQLADTDHQRPGLTSKYFSVPKGIPPHLRSPASGCGHGSRADPGPSR